MVVGGGCVVVGVVFGWWLVVVSVFVGVVGGVGWWLVVGVVVGVSVSVGVVGWVG